MRFDLERIFVHPTAEDITHVQLGVTYNHDLSEFINDHMNKCVLCRGRSSMQFSEEDEYHGDIPALTNWNRPFNHDIVGINLVIEYDKKDKIYSISIKNFNGPYAVGPNLVDAITEFGEDITGHVMEVMKRSDEELSFPLRDQKKYFEILGGQKWLEDFRACLSGFIERVLEKRSRRLVRS